MIESILLAEDNLEQCFFFRKAVREVAPHITLTTVHDGDSLMTLLEDFFPDILFLDLSMPCRDGMQCIQQIREMPLYDDLPIVVFTISGLDNAIQMAYQFGANLYFVKPDAFSVLVDSLEAILSMDWSDPKAIRKEQLQGGRFVPFLYPA